MVRLTKQNKADIKEYIVSCIDVSGYDSFKGDFSNNKDLLVFVYDCFKSEYGYNINRLGLHNAFSEWLQGLPSVFNVDFYNHEILRIAESWGQNVGTESQQDKVLSDWWGFITHQFFKILRYEKKEGVY